MDPPHLIGRGMPWGRRTPRSRSRWGPRECRGPERRGTPWSCGEHREILPPPHVPVSRGILRERQHSRPQRWAGGRAMCSRARERMRIHLGFGRALRRSTPGRPTSEFSATTPTPIFRAEARARHDECDFRARAAFETRGATGRVQGAGSAGGLVGGLCEHCLRTPPRSSTGSVFGARIPRTTQCLRPFDSDGGFHRRAASKRPESLAEVGGGFLVVMRLHSRLGVAQTTMLPGPHLLSGGSRWQLLTGEVESIVSCVCVCFPEKSSGVEISRAPSGRC